MKSARFHAADYAVFTLTLVSSLAIGLYFALVDRRKSTTEDYLMGGRKLGMVSVAISMCVSVVSASSLLGAPAEMYAYGIHYTLSVITIPLAIFVVAAFFVPLFYPLKPTSVNKYLASRFNSRVVQWIGALQAVVTQALYVGCVIYGPATALESVTGLPVWGSLLLISVTGTVYTAMGGMKAVIWTDVFQSGIMVAGLLAIVIQGTIKAGGVGTVWEVNKQYGRFDVSTRFDVYERYSLWTVLTCFTLIGATMYGVGQPAVQRFCAMDTLSKARWTVLLNAPALIAFVLLGSGAGMVAFAYYTRMGCDPLKDGQIDNANQLIPYFVMEILGFPGLPGLFVASLFSATLSTLSSSLSAMVAVTWQDVLESHFDHLSASRKMIINRVMVVGFGVVCLAVSFMVWNIGGNILQISLTLTSIISGSTFGLFLIGMLFPCANWMGAVCGAVASMAVTAWLGFGQLYHRSQRHGLDFVTTNCTEPRFNGSYWATTTSSQYTTMVNTAQTIQEEILTQSSGVEKLYSMSFALFPLIGLIVALVVGLVVSCLTDLRREIYVDPALVFPCIRRFCISGKPNKSPEKNATVVNGVHDYKPVSKEPFDVTSV